MGGGEGAVRGKLGIHSGYRSKEHLTSLCFVLTKVAVQGSVGGRRATNHSAPYPELISYVLMQAIAA